MRSVVPKLKYIFFIVVLNCVLVPLALRYWTCYVLQGKHFLKDVNTRYTLTINAENKASQGRRRIRPRACHPKRNAVFLKTHKTGGSTITNILNRYGEAHGLNFVLPRLGENRLDWPWFFQKDSFFPLNGSEPNILSNHARYNQAAMEAVMSNNTVYVTILRHPIIQFESTFSYMTLDKILGMRNSTHPIEEFFKDPESVLVNYVLTQDLRINSDRLKLIRNGMFYDLGLESKDFENKFKIRDAIEELDSNFNLVMMTEHFDESLVLLQRLLCWELDDMVYFRLKQRTVNWKQNISKELHHKIAHWSSADMALYQHFNRTFWKVLRHMGPDFWDDVKMLRAKNRIMEDLCLRPVDHARAELIQTAETKQHNLRRNIPRVAREMCKRMTWDEIKYLKHLREIQIEKIRHTHERPKRTFVDSFIWLANKFKT